MNSDVKLLKRESYYNKLISRIKESIADNLTKYKQIDSIILFGSYAKKSFTEESDIDLCVVFKEGIDNTLEDPVFEYFLSLGAVLKKEIQCIFVYCEKIKSLDRIFVENILAEGKLLFGSLEYKNLFKQALELEPYHIITLDLKKLSGSDKMRIKRMLYGYTTTKRALNRVYIYDRKGIVNLYNGKKLGRGSFIIPEKCSYLVEAKLENFKVRFWKMRIWIQKI